MFDEQVYEEFLRYFGQSYTIRIQPLSVIPFITRIDHAHVVIEQEIDHFFGNQGNVIANIPQAILSSAVGMVSGGVLGGFSFALTAMYSGVVLPVAAAGVCIGALSGFVVGVILPYVDDRLERLSAMQRLFERELQFARVHYPPLVHELDRFPNSPDLQRLKTAFDYVLQGDSLMQQRRRVLELAWSRERHQRDEERDRFNRRQAQRRFEYAILNGPHAAVDAWSVYPDAWL